MPGCPEVEIYETPPLFKPEAERAVTPPVADLEQALSLERFARYVAWAGGDRERALDLYTLNTRISEALYTPLQALELSLRNRIHTVMTAAHGARWFETDDLVQVPHQREQIADAVRDLVRDDKDPVPGRVVAALTFSFWTAMVSPIYEPLWRSTLTTIAVKPDGKRLSRKQLSRPLTDSSPAQPHRPPRADPPLGPAEAPRQHRRNHYLAFAGGCALVRGGRPLRGGNSCARIHAREP